jgi:DNA-binding transcriptional MerR regulator
MSDTDHSTTKRRFACRRLAEVHGVSPRTLDRWSAEGILPPPEYINGRKYGDPDVSPRLDQESQEVAE